jgi:hypothetical protein
MKKYRKKFYGIRRNVYVKQEQCSGICQEMKRNQYAHFTRAKLAKCEMGCTTDASPCYGGKADRLHPAVYTSDYGR